MKKSKTTTIEVQGTAIAVISEKDTDYISLTDMLKAKDGEFFISDWLRNRNTVEFLGIWESIYNPAFNYGEFATIRSQAGLNSYKISVKEWVEKTNAIGLKASPGRYGGTFAHPDIAFEFGMWISPEFKIYLVREFRRLKDDENRRLSLAWNLNRTLSKLNYRIHTDAIKAQHHPRDHNPGAGRDRLRQRGRSAQCRPLRANRETMARCQPQTRRQYARPRRHRAAPGPGQPRRHERRIDPHGPTARRAPEAAERDRHPADANPHRAHRRPPARPTGGGKRLSPLDETVWHPARSVSASASHLPPFRPHGAGRSPRPARPALGRPRAVHAGSLTVR